MDVEDVPLYIAHAIFYFLLPVLAVRFMILGDGWVGYLAAALFLACYLCLMIPLYLDVFGSTEAFLRMKFLIKAWPVVYWLGWVSAIPAWFLPGWGPLITLYIVLFMGVTTFAILMG